jgi:outer membrane protein OmpA-like peptidoglycan-associated protein
MTNDLCKFGLKLGYTAIAGAVAMALATGFSSAAEKSSSAIINSLKPKALTRSLTGAPADTGQTAADGKFIDSVRNRTSRSLSTGEREHIAAIAKEKPSTDLEINFDYNSASIGKSAKSQVEELGKALSDPALKGNTFVLAGYADKSGATEYNQTLSDRRADSVKRYLIENYKIPAANLVTVGYGSTHFKNIDDPFAAENRRVAVSNMADKKVSNNQ